MPRYRKNLDSATEVIVPEQLSGLMDSILSNSPGFIDDAPIGYGVNEDKYTIIPPHLQDPEPFNTEPVEGIEDPPTLTPAIYFEQRYVYTKDGCMEINSDIPNVIATLNSELMKQVQDSDTPEYHKFNQYTYMNIMRTNLISTINSYVGICNNIYSVFVARVNSDVISKYGINKFVLRKDDLITHDALSAAIGYYIAQNDARRQVIMDKYFQNYMLTYTNYIGQKIYTDTMTQMNIILSDISLRPDKIVALYDSIDKFFRAFMSDLNYEASIFIRNIGNSTLLFLNDAIRSISSKNNID